MAVSYALSASMTSCCCGDTTPLRAALGSADDAADRTVGGPLGLSAADASHPTSKGRARATVARMARKDECVIGCVDAWMRGCVDAWMRGCVDAWVSGVSGVRATIMEIEKASPNPSYAE